MSVGRNLPRYIVFNCFIREESVKITASLYFLPRAAVFIFSNGMAGRVAAVSLTIKSAKGVLFMRGPFGFDGSFAEFDEFRHVSSPFHEGKGSLFDFVGRLDPCA